MVAREGVIKEQLPCFSFKLDVERVKQSTVYTIQCISERFERSRKND